LSTAIERARAIFDEYGMTEVPVGEVTQTWGYKAVNTGPASVTYAALKRYGLLADRGVGDDRKVRLTGEAILLLRDPSPGNLQSAALRPTIFQDLWEQFDGQVPSDQVLRNWLVTERGFTETGYEELIRVYRENLGFAGLAPDYSVTPHARGTRFQGQPTMASSADDVPQWVYPMRRNVHVQSTRGVSRLVIPLAGGSAVTVEGDFPVTEDAWQQFMTVLQAMKPGLVEG